MSAPQEETWETLGAADGVRLRSQGTGRPLVVVPGMKGDGSSCLHVVLPVWRDLQRHDPVRLVLVDYAAEQHGTLPALEATLTRLLRAAEVEPAVVWGQSFGCLLAASAARAVGTDRLVLVSPFTDLPASRDLAAAFLPRIPRSLYRATATPTCRWVFGPAPGPEGAGFFAALAAADPETVARRAGWLRGRDHRAHFEGLLGDRARVWFGVRDRLIDLRGQLEVFTQLTGGGSPPELVPYAGQVVLPAPSVRFLHDRVTAWLSP